MKTKDEFLAWLKTLPPETEFCDGLRIMTCPIARFTGESAIPGAYSRGADDWMQRFMYRYDAGQKRSLADAIAIAEAL